MYATQTAQDTARDAVQIFGGRGITRTGMGRFIEHVSSSARAVSFRLEQLIDLMIDSYAVSPHYSVRFAAWRCRRRSW
jgi:hypothetical protein